MAIKILMADGDQTLLELAQASMSLLNWCDLVTEKDGREAAKCLRDQKFDGFVVADRIPGMDGFELIRYVKHSSLNAGIPIVMLTGEDDIDTMRRGFKAGVTFFAVKPRNRERLYHLFNAIRGAMETERRRHHRLPYHTPVTCNLIDRGRNHFVAESIEVSEGGMSVKPSGGVEIGRDLELEFLLPQVSRPAHGGTRKSRRTLFAEREAPLTEPQRVRSKVRYVAPSGEFMGLDFQNLKPSQREVIQQYIVGDS